MTNDNRDIIKEISQIDDKLDLILFRQECMREQITFTGPIVLIWSSVVFIVYALIHMLCGHLFQ